MKVILKPIFEMITGEYVIFDKIIYNHIIMLVIGVIAFVISWICVGNLLDENVISGSKVASMAHWAIRTVVFIGVFYIFSLIIWLTKFIYIHSYIIVIVVLLAIIVIIMCKIIKKYKNDKLN